MSLTVTLHIFSGRPDPVWTIPDEAEHELNQRVERLDIHTNLKAVTGLSGLGYRGFSIGRAETSHALQVHAGVVDPGTGSPSLIDPEREIEKWLMSFAGGSIPAEARGHVEEMLQHPVSSDSFRAVGHKPVCPACHAADAPVYNPALWNTPAVQPHNNCYNYANDQRTNTFAQPGRATGHQYTSLTCPSVQAAATSDGLAHCPNFTAPLVHGHGWYVALVIWPNVDYHWYRQDKIGCWSHKPGQTAVRNVDSSGHPITDPKTCNRGPYTQFCTYMITKHGVHIR